MDATRSATQMARYHADVTYLFLQLEEKEENKGGYGALGYAYTNLVPGRNSSYPAG